MSAMLERVAPKQTNETEESRFLVAPLLMCVLALWIAPMFTSLGADETGTWWVVKDGLHSMLERARMWPAGQSIVFDLLVLAARAIAGSSDFVMRLPSLLASGAALWLLFRLGRKFLGPAGAMFGCLVFVSLREVVYVAATVRPYALGLMCVVGAMLALVNWIDTNRARDGVAYSILAALSLHAHYLFAVMFVVHGFYIWLRLRDGTCRIGLKQVFTSWFGSAVLMIPAVPFVLGMARSPMQHVYLPPPGIETALVTLAPILLAGAIAAAILARGAAGKPVTFAGDICGSAFQMISAWALVPPGLIFLLSLATPLKLFAPRYYIAYAPGLALLAGAIFRTLGPRSARLAVAAAVAIAAVLTLGVNERLMRGTFDFRGAAEALRAHIGPADTPVLAVSLFTEADSVRAALDPAYSDVLFAPYLRYDYGGTLVRLPAQFDTDVQRYLDQVVTQSLVQHREFFLVGPMLAEYYGYWLRGRCAQLGFVEQDFGNFGGLGAMLFVRQQPSEKTPGVPNGR